MIQGEGIEEYKNSAPAKPLLSIITVTYNQEKYIEQCLDSILSQETNFDYELIIGEDDSPDKTREICKKYADKHPDKIRLILQSRKNVIKINGKPTGRFNLLYCLKAAKGKYIAFCEGDDFWVDTKKLQKQIDVLERNPEYSLVFTDVNHLIHEADGTLSNKTSILGSKNIPLQSEIKDIVKQNYIGTCTVAFRNWLKDEQLPASFVESPMGDWPLWILTGRKGSFYFMNEASTTYRIHAGGAWSMKSLIYTTNSKIKTLGVLANMKVFEPGIRLFLKMQQFRFRFINLKARLRNMLVRD